MASKSKTTKVAKPETTPSTKLPALGVIQKVQDSAAKLVAEGKDALKRLEGRKPIPPAPDGAAPLPDVLTERAAALKSSVALLDRRVAESRAAVTTAVSDKKGADAGLSAAITQLRQANELFSVLARMHADVFGEAYSQAFPHGTSADIGDQEEGRRGDAGAGHHVHREAPHRQAGRAA